MAYLVRRLLENTSNESFLRASFIEHVDPEALLARPRPVQEMPLDRRGSRAVDHGIRAAHSATPVERRDGEPETAASEEFRNEPHLDFTEPEARVAFAQAVENLAQSLATRGPIRVPLWIDGKELTGEHVDRSADPADPARVVAEVCRGGIADADAAVAAAVRAFPRWRDTPASDRAAVLLRAAAWLRKRREEIAALEVFEVGKPWREADGDVCEAIDFLEYYGREMLRLGKPRKLGDLPGEDNQLVYEGRGVAVVIAPWNFPLAIVTGMTAAALVAGNTVIVKPAEQSPAVAWKIVEALRAGGAPAGVIAFVPGPGESVGAHLVAHRDVDLIAFTGSMKVGLAIVEVAGRTVAGQRSVKRVIAEMGGKNAIIVDDDADLDEAVSGVIRSAFEYAGQKCSACSRAVVLDAVHDAFLARLVAAAASLRVGPPREPATQLGPIVDEQQYRSVVEWQRIAAEEGTVVLQAEAPAGGWFVGPTIVTGIRPEHRLAREEIFGPVLAVMHAADFDEALAVANGTAYALTGGVYSRSPAHIARAQREFRVGNLYINRPITGAKVGRQPFGGARTSGVGSKAGGPDYLLQFLEPRVVTENTVRRGFSPDVS
jgi:RHH-type proline utilization regulon transcriptional repressor/proline dehydrogenase/delta 1-pyrroline-5-carboxylate dehydrogenase